MNNPSILTATSLSKHYVDGSHTIKVIDDLDLSIEQGEMVAIVGTSGSGKSTLLHMLGSLDLPTHGELTINGKKTNALTEKQKCRVRNHDLGFIYQFHHLLAEFDVVENVAMALLIRGDKIKDAKKSAIQMLHRVGMGHRLNFRIGQLSGGEKQRVTIARALVTRPKCVLADEPTGNCDDKTAAQLRDLMTSLNQEYQTSFVVVTHDLRLANKMHRVLRLENGKLVACQGGATTHN